MKMVNVKKAMKENRIFDEDDAKNAIEFVERLLMDEIQDTIEEYPHATRTINELRIAKERVTSLYHDSHDWDFDEEGE